MDVADRMKALRKARSWTQLKAADYFGVNRSVISRIESGQEPSGPVERLLDIAERETAQPNG